MKIRIRHFAIKRRHTKPYWAILQKWDCHILLYRKVYSINTEEELETLEDSQETVILESQSNLTQKDIPLFSTTTESLIEIQEFMDSNPNLSSTLLHRVMKNI
ncbi:hypothetical protein CDAR_406511 [Caerostris darwini]|uniref:Uncharacterized protein n=1 Tax=Caerostris darwini TaxID=1538125 RepID=A0AAV4MNR4_9ARAC|nr:hypothetical protein CDAR_406511 [Caerostris darwini]